MLPKEVVSPLLYCRNYCHQLSLYCRPSCNNTAPTPLLELSVSMMNGLLKTGTSKTIKEVMAVLSCLMAFSASTNH